MIKPKKNTILFSTFTKTVYFFSPSLTHTQGLGFQLDLLDLSSTSVPMHNHSVAHYLRPVIPSWLHFLTFFPTFTDQFQSSEHKFDKRFREAVENSFLFIHYTHSGCPLPRVAFPLNEKSNHH